MFGSELRSVQWPRVRLPARGIFLVRLAQLFFIGALIAAGLSDLVARDGQLYMHVQGKTHKSGDGPNTCVAHSLVAQRPRPFNKLQP